MSAACAVQVGRTGRTPPAANGASAAYPAMEAPATKNRAKRPVFFALLTFPRQRLALRNHLAAVALHDRVVVIGPAIAVDVALVLLEAAVHEAPLEPVAGVADVGQVEQRVEHILRGQVRLAVAQQLADLVRKALLVLV